ncbi:MAG: terminase [Oxalobacteraceae bacterium]|nr:MAG: terminase [Oxalobacteraceae bacterium]
MKPADRMLAEDMAGFYDNPLGFVLYAFDWGEGDLDRWQGPDEWQTEYLRTLGDAIKARASGDVIKMAVKSGRGPGKSAVIAWLVLWLMSTRPNFSGVVTANTGDQLDTKTWREVALWLSRAINKHWFDWSATKLVHKEAPETWKIVAQKWSEHKPDAFGGLHNNGRGQCTIMDEGSGIPESIFAVAEATNTDPDSFVFTFGNPTRRASYFFQIFSRFRHRWLTMTVDTRRAKAANQKQIADMIEDWGLDSDHVRVNVLGEFPQTDSDTLIPLTLLEGAAKREVAPDSLRMVKPIWSVDVARFGDDRTAVCKRRGRALMEPVTSWRGLDTMQTAGRVKAMYDECADDERPSHIVVDVIGIGSGVVDRLREMQMPVFALNVSESPAVDGKFAKRRDELWWSARKWFEGLDVSMQDQALAAELSDVLYGYTSAGLIKVEGKQETKDRLGRSPDLADAFIGSFAVTPVAVQRETDRYERARQRAMQGGGGAWAC